MTQSLVLQLQADASTGSTPLPDVLRKARMVATKLKLSEMNLWIEHELHGYPENVEVPRYRVLHGDVRAHNPYNGCLMPVRWDDPRGQERLSIAKIGQSVGGLHEVLSEDSEFLQVPFGPAQEAALRHSFPDHLDCIVPFRLVNKAHVAGILDAVRNRILDWTLKLEAEGILGEGMTFSQEEKAAAQNVVFNINNSTIDQLNSSGNNLKKAK